MSATLIPVSRGHAPVRHEAPGDASPLPMPTGPRREEIDDFIRQIVLRTAPSVEARASGLVSEARWGGLTLAPAQLADLGSVASAFNATSSSVWQEPWGRVVGSLSEPTPTDVNSLVQWVLRESYLATTEDLYMYAEKVKFYNATKKQIRDELTRAREVLSGYAGAPDTAALQHPYVPVMPNDDFTVPPGSGQATETASAQQTTPEDETPEEPEEPEVPKPEVERNGTANISEYYNYGGGGGHADIRRLTQYAIQKAANYLAGLSPLQRQAVYEHLKEHGMRVHFDAQDRKGDDHNWEMNQVVRMKPGESLEAFVTRALSGGVSRFVDQIMRDDDIGCHGMKVIASLPRFKVNGDEEAWAEATGGVTATGANYGGGVDPSRYQPDGTAPSRDADGNIITKAGLDAHIKALEEKLSSVGDDAQLANVDLQNLLQKQQQTLQLMSNMSKMLHDTAMATIRKIGG